MAERLRDCLVFARQPREIRRDDEASALWRRVYPDLSDGEPGLLGAMTARAEAQVMRIALVFALLDRSTAIRVEHLRAGLAVWAYADQSARYVFGKRLGDEVQDTILDALRSAAPNGLTRQDLGRLFGGHRKAAAIRSALATLSEGGLATSTREATGERDAERWFAIAGEAQKARNPPLTSLPALPAQGDDGEGWPPAPLSGMAAGVQPPVDDEDYELEERAAIRQHDGGVPPPDCDHLAATDIATRRRIPTDANGGH